MLGGGDEEIDVPGARGDFLGLRRPPQADFDGVGIADRRAGGLDDAAQRGGAGHGEVDLGLRARGIAPPRLDVGLGQPAANAEAVLRGSGAQGGACVAVYLGLGHAHSL